MSGPHGFCADRSGRETDPMQIFLSWSGAESRRAADALRTWLTGLFTDVGVWMSEHDIEAGSPWATALHDQLRRADFGVLCMTADNLQSPWIIYEAGALAVTAKPGCVVPYLLGIAANTLPAPLGKFQSAIADREGTWKVVRSIATQLAEKPVEGLRGAFEAQWPTLAEQLGLAIQTTVIDGIFVIRLTDDQIENAAEMQALIERIKSHLLASNKEVIVDLSEVSYMSSGSGRGCGMSFITWLLGRAYRDGVKVAFVGLKPQIVSLLNITRVLSLLRHFANANEAIAYLKQSR